MTKIVPFALFLLFIACSKHSNTPSTSLKITVTDSTNNPVPGATVDLYSSFAAWSVTNGTNQVGTQTTDQNGNVLFTNLQPLEYYWHIEKGCQANDFGFSSISTVNPITTQIENDFTCILGNLGTVEYVNTSSDPYTIYLDGNEIEIMGGDSTLQFQTNAGYHTLNVIQQSGYATSPINETITGTMGCGDTLKFTFP
jgi:Carboxypeptidase regulatory-like domain